jgi:hypothetical protein
MRGVRNRILSSSDWHLINMNQNPIIANHEQQCGLNDGSKPSVDADLELAAVQDEAADERLQILIPPPQPDEEPSEG